MNGLLASTVAITIAICALVAPSTQQATGEPSLLRNGGFESPNEASRQSKLALPDDWTLFTSSNEAVVIGVTVDQASEGEQALRVTSRSAAGAFHGLVQEIEVHPGQELKVDAEVRNDPTTPMSGTVRGQLSFEWLGGNEEVGRSYSGDWDQTLQADAWTPVTFAATAPPRADRVRIVITLYEGDAPTGGAFFIDDLQLSTSAE